MATFTVHLMIIRTGMELFRKWPQGNFEYKPIPLAMPKSNSKNHFSCGFVLIIYQRRRTILRRLFVAIHRGMHRFSTNAFIFLAFSSIHTEPTLYTYYHHFTFISHRSNTMPSTLIYSSFMKI